MKLKTKLIAAVTISASLWGLALTILPAAAQVQSQYPPGPIITIQLANIDELCGGYNVDSFDKKRDYIRALTMTIRLQPAEDKRSLILKCAGDLEIAHQQGRIDDGINRLALGWVLMSCLTLFDLGYVDTKTCSEVRLILNRNINER